VLVGDAAACTCAGASPRTRLDASDAAFIGRLLSARQAPERDGVAQLVYVFSVDSVVKGELAERVEVRSPAEGATCGFELEPEEASGILLHRDGDGWVGGLCGQIAVGELIDAAESTETKLVNWGGIVVGSAVLALGAFLIWRRLQAKRRLQQSR